MQRNELISIIVPVYKVEKYINRCVDSILAQTYKNLEVILVDDDSSDSCPTICDEYAKKDNRVRVVHKKNEGVSAARNDGISIANGKFICFVDSDDYVAENYVQKMVEEQQKNNADVVFCSYYNVCNKVVSKASEDLKELVYNKKIEMFFSTPNNVMFNLAIVDKKRYIAKY